MRTLLLIPSVLRLPRETGPRMDYHALAESLGIDGEVDLFDYAAVDASVDPAVRFVRRLAGRDAALALLGFRHRRDYNVIFSNGENVGIPLALLLKIDRRRPGHVTIGHRLSTGKKRIFFTLLQAHREIDRILLYATSQLEFARTQLRLPAEKLKLIAFHADQMFYRPMPEAIVENQICSAGLEWRDYPTLIEAVREMPDLAVKLAAASPWSKHANETEGRTLPVNVDARRYEYHELRDLYASSKFVVVPLYENDFQAGITTILEGMAMGKAVIATRTTGQTDAIVDGINGVLVPVGDPAALRVAMERLHADAALAESLGQSAREWLVANASLDFWVENVAQAIRDVDR